MVDTIRATQILSEVEDEVTSPTIRASQVLAEVEEEVASPTIQITQVLSEVEEEVASPTIQITQILAEIEWEPYVAPVIPCLITNPTNKLLAARYYVGLKNTSGVVTYLFDSWDYLEYKNELGGRGYYAFGISGDDYRIPGFILDAIFEVHRSIPGVGVDWYVDFRGLNRIATDKSDKRGDSFVSKGFSLNDFLARTRIAYKAGTIKADKDAPAETAMKEYVEENCGPSATIANGREAEGYLSGFSTDTTTGAGGEWAGSRAFENLLDVLKEISNFARIDFAVEYTGPAQFEFRTYADQLGDDRTDLGYNSITGKNGSGNDPVIFSVLAGNVQELEHIVDRSAEATVCFVLGKGEGSTRTIVAMENPSAKAASPWNRCETVVTGQNQDFNYQLQTTGMEVLKENQAKEIFTFVPLQQESCLYGKHYFLGDYVVVVKSGVKSYKRLVSVKVHVEGSEESLEMEFADIV